MREKISPEERLKRSAMKENKPGKKVNASA